MRVYTAILKIILWTCSGLLFPLFSALGQENFFRQLENIEAFEQYSEIDPVSQTRELKYFIPLDQEEGPAQDIIFLNSKKYHVHSEFLSDMQNKEELDKFGLFKADYSKVALTSGKRLALSGALIWHPQMGWLVNLYSIGDKGLELIPSDLQKHLGKLIERLKFLRSSETPVSFASSMAQYQYLAKQKLLDNLPVPVLSPKDLITRPYLPYVEGQCYGYLSFYNKEKFEQVVESGMDIAEQIVLLDHLPIEIPQVAGIISTVPQTALSHLSVKARQRKTPNLFTADKKFLRTLKQYAGKPVKLEVGPKVPAVSLSTPEEVKGHYERQKGQHQFQLKEISYDRPKEALTSLEEVNSQNNNFGGKAANYAWLQRYFKSLPSEETKNFQVEDAYAIGLHFYQEFLKVNGLDSFIKEKLAEIEANPGMKVENLNTIRKKIKKAKIMPEGFIKQLKDELRTKFAHIGDSHRIRFRSSSNAEDQNAFSGAGLYESTWICLADMDNAGEKSLCNDKSNKKKRTVEDALKKVWSSLYSLKAYNERAIYNIPQDRVAMGILVHEGFEREILNGVAVTKDLETDDPAGGPLMVTLNILPQENSVVLPEDGIFPEVIVRSDKERKLKKLSNLSKDKSMLTDKEEEQLSNFLFKLQQDYLNDHKLDVKDTAIDVELKAYPQVDEPGNNGKRFVIKQIRPYQR